MRAVAILAVWFILFSFPICVRGADTEDPLLVRLLQLPVSVGENRVVTMQRGESWTALGMREHAGYEQLRRANPNGVKRGPLFIAGLHLVDTTLDSGILVNIPELTLFYLRDHRVVHWYPVAVGMVQPIWHTPTGSFHIVSKERNPIWRIPNFAGGGTMPPGLRNPLGDRLLNVSYPSPEHTDLGIHSTNNPTSIGRMASHACIRMFPPHIHELFELVEPDAPVVITYETVKVGRQKGIVYLAVFPDIYQHGVNTLTNARERLIHYRLSEAITEQELGTRLARPDGVARPLLGSNMPVIINGMTTAFPVGPTRRDGRLYLPLATLATATGAQVELDVGQDVVRITRNGKTATLTVNGLQAFHALDAVFVQVHSFTGSFGGKADSSSGSLRITLPMK